MGRLRGGLRGTFFFCLIPSSLFLSADSIEYRLYANLKANPEWISDLHNADAIIVATHSQGSIVSTHLLDRLIRDGHIATARDQDQDQDQNQNQNQDLVIPVGLGVGVELFPSPVGLGVQEDERKRRKVQRVCCLALCGIHLGPLRYLGSSTLVGPYLQVRSIFLFYILSCWKTDFSISSQLPRESSSSFRIRRVLCQRHMWQRCRMFLIME